MSKLANKVALVTGGSRGIGAAIAKRLAADGAKVAITYAKDAIAAADVVKAIELGGGKAVAIQADAADAEAVKTAVEMTILSFGRLDVLFNNAGIGAKGVPLEDLSYEQWNDVVSVNLTGSFLCAQEAIHQMKSQEPRGGRIINNGSISAYTPRPFSAPYVATKHAIAGLTKSISLDCREYNIACSQIDIGNAATDLIGKTSVPTLQANGSWMQEPRMDVKHVAEAVLYMVSLPLDANVQTITVMATNMPYIGRG